VQVCPTGIDIRGGLQMECVGCAQCIDACDNVMDKIGLPRGLIRYSSASAVAGEKTKLLRPRVIIYPTLIVVLLSALTFLILTRAAADVSLLRNLGRPFVVLDTGRVENIINLKLTNRADRPLHFVVSIPEHPTIGIRATDHDDILLQHGQMWTEPLQVSAPQELFKGGKLDVWLNVKTTSDDGRIDETFRRPFQLKGPGGNAIESLIGG